MNVFLQIMIALCAVYGFYMLICAVTAKWGEAALDEQGCKCGEDEISIFATAENLEYCLRAAIAESNLSIKKITVNIFEDSPEREELVYIAEAFRRRHGNIRIKMI